MKTKTLKQILATTMLATTILITNAGISKAALQANQNTQYTKEDVPVNWMKAFRQMETAGGAMGLNETLSDDLTASSESNGIDVHMMRTTEYGAIAILSASGYGNSSNDKIITTTTGNSTGVILNVNTNIWEYNAGGLSGSIFSGVNSRYFDTYTGSQSSARIGDTLGTELTTNPGCTGWHSAANSDWVNGTYPCFVRGGGGIFSYGYDSGRDSYFCRGVAVVGSGL